MAPGCEPVNPEMVEQLRDVGGCIPDRAAWLSGRGDAVARAVVADEADPALAGVVDGVRVEPAGGRRAVMGDDGGPVRSAFVVDVQRPTVREGEVAFAHSPGRSGVP